jgi:hypothetical protein
MQTFLLLLSDPPGNADSPLITALPPLQMQMPTPLLMLTTIRRQDLSHPGLEPLLPDIGSCRCKLMGWEAPAAVEPNAQAPLSTRVI